MKKLISSIKEQRKEIVTAINKCSKKKTNPNPKIGKECQKLKPFNGRRLRQVEGTGEEKEGKQVEQWAGDSVREEVCKERWEGYRRAEWLQAETEGRDR